MATEITRQEPLIIAIGGGKGGVGKSMVSANLGVQYAQAGCRVILIDLDIGAANLHTIFGIRQPPKSLGDFFMTSRTSLAEYVISTEVPNLQIIPGSGFVPELANLKHSQKVKLVNHIKALDADIILLDLGAGTSNHVVDFFSMTHAGIVVTTPEPTAIVNAYEFLKNVVYRILFRMFKNQEEIINILKMSVAPKNTLGISSVADLIRVISEKNPWAGKNIAEVCEGIDLYLVFNQTRKASDVELGMKLCTICHRFLNISLHFAGVIFHNEEVSASVFKMSPISLVYPESVTSTIPVSIFDQLTKNLINGKQAVDFDGELNQVMRHAKHDFQLNLLAQKRLLRDQERHNQNTESLLPNTKM
jgi:flagellar biosynthesis protein FlhG